MLSTVIRNPCKAEWYMHSSKPQCCSTLYQPSWNSSCPVKLHGLTFYECIFCVVHEWSSAWQIQQVVACLYCRSGAHTVREAKVLLHASALQKRGDQWVLPHVTSSHTQSWGRRKRWALKRTRLSIVQTPIHKSNRELHTFSIHFRHTPMHSWDAAHYQRSPGAGPAGGGEEAGEVGRGSGA